MQAKLGTGYIISGNATKDAEYSVKGEKNTKITKFGVAVGQNEDGSTKYANCVCFGRLAEYASAITKGTPVCAIGRVETRDYNGKVYVDLICEWISYVPENSNTVVPSVGQEFSQPITPSNSDIELDDDLPF